VRLQLTSLNYPPPSKFFSSRPGGAPAPTAPPGYGGHVTLVECVVGLAASLWTEMVRTSEQLDYMLFPRLLAVAERAWHEADWQSADTVSQMKSRRREDWEQFANTIGYRELRNLERSGIKYRLPPPGVR